MKLAGGLVTYSTYIALMCVDLDGHPLLVAIIVAVFEQSCLSCIIISDFEKAKEDCCVCQKCMRS